MHISAHRTARRNTTRTTVEFWPGPHAPPEQCQGAMGKNKDKCQPPCPSRTTSTPTNRPTAYRDALLCRQLLTSSILGARFFTSGLSSAWANGTLQKNELIGLAVACVMWFCEHFLLCAAPLSFWPLATQVFEQVEARPEQIFDLSTSSARRPTNAPTDALSRQ